MIEFKYIRILLVEDNKDTANVLGKLLELDGSDVEVAHDVNAAVRAAASETFDLLISDIGLPDGNGCELMRLLKKKYALEGIAITGFNTIDEEQTREAGFHRFLRKPISFEHLKGAIDDVLKKKSRSSLI